MFGKPVHSVQPLGPASAYQTYGIHARPDTGEVAACHEVGCEAWRNGWETAVDEGTDLGRAQAAYIRHGSRRTFTETRTGGGLTVFRFESGQRCFAEHRTKRDLFTSRDGDWRGNPTGRVYVHTRPEDWVEDFAEHEGRLADLRQRG